ncbi:MAG TPA: hypothetical protein ENG75_02785, partial [Nitrospirae bacterium]|nr:hypothetical protein [Nitrospirota bacterium]
MLIVVSNQLSREEIRRYSKGRSGYILFNYGEDADVFSKTLESNGFEHIDLRNIIINSRGELRRAVIDFTGALNTNPPHPDWWAILISRRVAMYEFANALAKLFIVQKIIETADWDTIILYDGSISPWNYLRSGKHRIDAKFITLFSMKTDWQQRLESILPLRTVLWFLKKIVTKTRLGWHPSEIKSNFNASPVVMFTLIAKNSFTKERSFKDVYFGDLAKCVEADGYSPVVMGQLHDKLTGDLLNNINSKKDNSFFLLEHIWSLKDLLSVFKRGLKDFFGREPEWPLSDFAGFDVKEFLNVNLKWELQAGYTDSLLYYKATKNILEKISPELLIYPYENKCTERMFLKAVSEVSPDTKTIGYQHAVLTPKHIHMFLAKDESESLPLPDRIVTNGPYTARLLRETGNYPEGMITAGTALRQAAEIPDEFIKKESPKRVKNVLLTLAEGVEEYDKGLAFLRDIQKSNDTGKIDFRVRLHP